MKTNMLEASLSGLDSTQAVHLHVDDQISSKCDGSCHSLITAET